MNDTNDINELNIPDEITNYLIAMNNAKQIYSGANNSEGKYTKYEVC